MTLPLSSTPRSTVTRLRERARTDRAELYAVLDAALLCHLGLVVDGAPVVLPTGYGRIGDTLYVHGSTGAGWLRAAEDAPVCVTVTHLDGIVYARSVFHHSMNYRSAVVHAVARRVTDPDGTAGRPARHRRAARPRILGPRPAPDRRELAATAVLAVDLAEASVKVRTGPPRRRCRGHHGRRAVGGRAADAHRVRLPAAPPPDLRRRRGAATCRRPPERGHVTSARVRPAPYPDAERLELVEELHGHRVADPYRWLEDPDDPRTVAWSATQDRLARGHLDALPGRATLAEKIRNLLEAGVGVGAAVAGRPPVRHPPRAGPGARGAARHGAGRRAPRPARPAGARPDRADDAGQLAARPGGPAAGLPALPRRRRGVGAARARRDHRRGRRRSDRPLPLLLRRLAPGGEELVYVRKVAPDQARPGEATSTAGSGATAIGTDPAGTSSSTAPASTTSTRTTACGSPATGAGSSSTGNVGTARRDSVWIAGLTRGHRRPRSPRSSRRPTTSSAPRGSTATDGSTCTPPTGPRAGGSPSPIPAPRRASTGASWSPRTRTRCSTAVRLLAPADTDDPGDALLVLARSRHAVAELALHRGRRRCSRSGPSRCPAPAR